MTGGVHLLAGLLLRRWLLGQDVLRLNARAVLLGVQAVGIEGGERLAVGLDDPGRWRVGCSCGARQHSEGRDVVVVSGRQRTSYAACLNGRGRTFSSSKPPSLRVTHWGVENEKPSEAIK
jgi:hypothetical protein